MPTTADDLPRAAHQAVTYSRVLHLDTRDGAGTDDLLALAKRQATDPSILEEFPPFFFGAEVSNNQWDAYDTRMMPSTLKNYAQDCADGVSFLRNHNTREDPVGHSLTGTFTGAQGNGIARIRAQFYMLTDPESAGYVNKIRSGVVRDVSVGFYGGTWVCTICGQDMQDWYSRDGCPHMLGMTYTPKDEAGKQVGDPVKARANIEDAHMAEASGVYDGATPGAMIDKARAMNDAGLLDHRMHDLVQVRYRIALPGGSRIHAVPDLGRPATTQEGTSMADQEDTRSAPETTPPPSPHEATLAQIRAAVKDVLPADHAGHTDPLEAVRWLVADRARLAPLADDGRAYRADLVEQALADGVRANGPAFAQETYRAMLEAAPLAVIVRMRDDWKALGDKQFPGGRASADTEQQAAIPATPVYSTPNAAYLA